MAYLLPRLSCPLGSQIEKASRYLGWHKRDGEGKKSESEVFPEFPGNEGRKGWISWDGLGKLQCNSERGVKYILSVFQASAAMGSQVENPGLCFSAKHNFIWNECLTSLIGICNTGLQIWNKENIFHARICAILRMITVMYQSQQTPLLLFVVNSKLLVCPSSTLGFSLLCCLRLKNASWQGYFMNGTGKSHKPLRHKVQVKKLRS